MSTGWRARSVCVNKLKKKKEQSCSVGKWGHTWSCALSCKKKKKKKQFERAAG